VLSGKQGVEPSMEMKAYRHGNQRRSHRDNTRSEPTSRSDFAAVPIHGQEIPRGLTRKPGFDGDQESATAQNSERSRSVATAKR
jgi:hypothetical protein